MSDVDIVHWTAMWTAQTLSSRKLPGECHRIAGELTRASSRLTDRRLVWTSITAILTKHSKVWSPNVAFKWHSECGTFSVLIRIRRNNKEQQGIAKNTNEYKSIRKHLAAISYHHLINLHFEHFRFCAEKGTRKRIGLLIGLSTGLSSNWNIKPPKYQPTTKPLDYSVASFPNY